MAIAKLVVSNFKSFDEIDIEIGKFGIVIGANASGKSNLIQVFRFIRDILNFGLENAISMQGGLGYLVNANIGSAKEICIEITCDAEEEHVPPILATKKTGGVPGMSAFSTIYRFALRVNDKKNTFEITEDSLMQRCKFYKYVRYGNKLKIESDLGKGRILFRRIHGTPELHLEPPRGSNIKTDEIFQLYATNNMLRQYKLGAKELLMKTPCLYFIGHSMLDILKGIAIYDFDPKLSKKPQAITGKAKLEEDGSNLAIAVSNLLRSGTKRRKFYNLIRDVLPSIGEIRTQELANTMLFKIKERYFDNQFFPAFLVSDGTINLTALTIALFFEMNEFTIIEEPERNIHPYLISKVVEFMREASFDTQILTTTHNPELIKHANPNELFLVSRNKGGNSSIIKPAKKKEVKTFLKNKMNLEELFIENLLEV